MDFFQAQDDALKRSRFLGFWFTLCVLGVILAVSAVAIAISYLMEPEEHRQALSLETIPWDVLGPVGLGTFLIIVGGSLFKLAQLSRGGSVVAADLGGRLVDPHTTDPHESRLINIVEEMAIASGVPVPQVYLMDQEEGINAFAAGTQPSNAVIGVTRGCLLSLNRSELSGVIAHEFSHILNGDMRLNIRLIGFIFGLIGISLLGKTLLNVLRFGSYSRSRSSNRDEGGGAVIAILVIGVSLWVIGAVGVLFARLLQSAISRQREYLADASAVQFTRDPDSIAGALKKIGGISQGSRLSNPKAMEASHMFFGDGGFFTMGFATHPSLESRIKAVTPSWDGSYPEVTLPNIVEGKSGKRSKSNPAMSQMTSGAQSIPPALPASLEDFSDLGQTQLQHGVHILESFPAHWIEAVHHQDQAQALLFGLLLAEDGALHQREMSELRSRVGSDTAAIAKEWHQSFLGMHSARKIALIDLAIPTLRQLSYSEYQRFITVTQWLISSDEKVDLFEFMIQRVIERHLSSHFERQGEVRLKYRKLSSLKHEGNVIFSTLAGVGARNKKESHEAYQRGIASQEGWSEEFLSPDQCGLNAVGDALDKFLQATPLLRKELLLVCCDIVSADGALNNREAELLRAIADTIGASIPPVVQNLDEIH